MFMLPERARNIAVAGSGTFPGTDTALDSHNVSFPSCQRCAAAVMRLSKR